MSTVESHTLAERATAAYGSAWGWRAMVFSRRKCSLRGTTTGLNWVARYAEEVLKGGWSWFPSWNINPLIIPWQQSCRKQGAKLVYVYLKRWHAGYAGQKSKPSEKTKFVSITYMLRMSRGDQSDQEYLISSWSWSDNGRDGEPINPSYGHWYFETGMRISLLSGHKMAAPAEVGTSSMGRKCLRANVSISKSEGRDDWLCSNNLPLGGTLGNLKLEHSRAGEVLVQQSVT